MDGADGDPERDRDLSADRALGRDLRSTDRPDRVVYVGHATVLVELDGARLLTDPVLGEWLGPLRRQGPAPPSEVTERLDAVLISHLHRDHVDPGSLRRVAAGVPLIVPAGTHAYFERRGFDGVVELARGESHQIGPLRVTATRADHPIGGRGIDAASVGFLVEGSRRAYFAGDTDLFEEMAAFGEGGLDLALLPVWGWGPKIGPGHMDPERAARAAALLGPRLAVPIHWGTLYPAGLGRLRPLPLTEPPRLFAANARVHAPEVEVRIAPPGSAVAFPPPR